MRIESFKIENYRNLQIAECKNVPDFMIVCGGNGCGKSSLLEALMTAKEHAGAYGNFTFDPRSVSSNADKATISIFVSFSDEEREFAKKLFGIAFPERDDVVIEILKGGSGRAIKRSTHIKKLFSYYSKAKGSPGFFDYITAHRQTQKQDLRNWDASFLADDLAKQTLARPQNKFQQTKQYLAGLKMHDLQKLQGSLCEGNPCQHDSLKEIKDLFNRFFAPLKFKDVYIDRSPFEFAVSTPSGDIDVDDLSSGEKEIFNIFVRFHQLDPHGCVILFDEADAHLHPDLERRYLDELRSISKGNQVILTTHSPEMMIAAGSESLYTIHKEPIQNGSNQLVRVTEDGNLHEVLSDLMGSRGLVSFNQKIVFIEGKQASADRAIFEALYPAAEHNISFVPAGDSSTIRRVAEHVNALLTSAISFQQYYCIIDHDIDRADVDPTEGERLFRLPVYHVENFLLDINLLFENAKRMLGTKCPYKSSEDIDTALKNMLLADGHLLPYTKALFDSKIGTIAKQAHDAIFKGTTDELDLKIPKFSEVQVEARKKLESSLADGTWLQVCKGRDLIKVFCREHGINYEHFRNGVIASFTEPPKGLAEIIEKILA